MTKSANKASEARFDSMQAWAPYSAFSGMQARLMRELLVLNGQVLDFVHRRVQHDLEVSGQLCECQSPEEAAEVLRGYYDTAFRQYSEEATTLLSMTREIGQCAFGNGFTAGLGGGEAGGASERPSTKGGRSG